MTYGTTRALHVAARASALAAAMVSIAGAGCGDDETGSGGAGGAGGAATVAASTSSSSAATVTVGPGPSAGGGGSAAEGGGGSDAEGGASSQGGSPGVGGSGGSGGDEGSGGAGGSGGEGGAPPAAFCTETAPGETRGSPIAVSPDDGTLVVANRDAGTVTVLAVAEDASLPAMTERAELAVGGEPWQVAIDACGDRAYVVLRQSQEVVVIEDLKTIPVVGASIPVGSEPTGLALSPNGTRLFVANWVDGTVSVIDPREEVVVETIDFNATLATSGFLGDGIAPRPALAHPRSVAVTNDGDASDDDETFVVTEFFGQRNAPEAVDGANADVNWEGLLYRRGVSGGAVGLVSLGPLADIGFTDPAPGGGTRPAGCFPNQLQSVTVRGGVAYVLSICASPRGPTGGANVKTTTHPVLSAVNIATGVELAASPVSLAAELNGFYETNAFANDGTRRIPLVANDLAFDAGSGDGWITANGVDAAFRVVVDATDGSVEEVGDGASRPFIDLASDDLDAADRGVGPIGIASANEGSTAFIASDITRNVTAIDTTAGASEVAGLSTDDARVIASADLPADADDLAALRGKQAFNTGLAGLSLLDQGWGACQVCHFEGLSDNVTWYFGRGPRQSTSLDGSYATGDPTDQRIFNWTGVFDEAADFEGVARSIDGARGNIVDAQGAPIDLANTTLSPPAGAAGLNGSADALMAAESSLQTWADVKTWIQRIRSPRAPVGLDADLVADGAELFGGEGGCVGCHGGPKWTLSKLFYEPSGATNEALKTTAWDATALAAAGFPTELFPAADGNRFMRRNTDGDQVQCVLRPVGTFGISPADVAVRELKADMVATAQGGNANSHGYNVPSLLGMSVGAPFFHGGNARTLEELLADVFLTHRAALADDGFMSGGDEGQQRAALVAFLLSVDESTAALDLPAVGPDGGDFCAPPPD